LYALDRTIARVFGGAKKESVVEPPQSKDFFLCVPPKDGDRRIVGNRIT
jgi:hypothetical protein